MFQNCTSTGNLLIFCEAETWLKTHSKIADSINFIVIYSIDYRLYLQSIKWQMTNVLNSTPTISITFIHDRYEPRKTVQVSFIFSLFDSNSILICRIFCSKVVRRNNTRRKLLRNYTDAMDIGHFFGFYHLYHHRKGLFYTFLFWVYVTSTTALFKFMVGSNKCIFFSIKLKCLRRK